MEYGQAHLVGVPIQDQAEVSAAVWELGIRITFGTSYGMFADVVGIFKTHFSLDPEEVDVLAAVLSSVDAASLPEMLGLTSQRIQRHIRRLCLAFQVKRFDEIEPAALSFIARSH